MASRKPLLYLCAFRINIFKMKKRQFVYMALAFLLLMGMSSCRKKSINNPLTVNSVGAPWELLVVMDKSDWEAPQGRALFEVLDADVPALPQSEPRFKISRCDNADFDGLLKPVRNILLVEISHIYSRPKIHVTEDMWANSQIVMRIVAPDNESFAKFVQDEKELIYQYFELAERKRNLQYIKRTHNRELSRLVMLKMGYEVQVPKFMERFKVGENFIWLSNDRQRKHQDMVIYSYPYTDKNTFTLEYLNAKRDSVMKANIPGGPEGSYMGREDAWPETFTEINFNGKYAVEIRGLWDMKGDMLGGPYVSITRLDDQNQRIVTAEIFIYAPEEDKRNLLKHNEAALYTLKLPGEFKHNEQ